MNLISRSGDNPGLRFLRGVIEAVTRFEGLDDALFLPVSVSYDLPPRSSEAGGSELLGGAYVDFEQAFTLREFLEKSPLSGERQQEASLANHILRAGFRGLRIMPAGLALFALFASAGCSWLDKASWLRAFSEVRCTLQAQVWRMGFRGEDKDLLGYAISNQGRISRYGMLRHPTLLSYTFDAFCFADPQEFFIHTFTGLAILSFLDIRKSNFWTFFPALRVRGPEGGRVPDPPGGLAVGARRARDRGRSLLKASD